MKKLVVLGGGESGVGTAILAKEKGYQVFVSDFGAIKQQYKEELNKLAILFEENKHTEELILDADIIVKSPGIPDKAPIIKKAKEKQLKIIGEIEFAYLYSKSKIIGITGSNGKTTTTLLMHHILQQSGVKAAMGGNVGKSYARIIAEGLDFDWIVLELSSFQLDSIETFSPDIAMILNITKDHLDRYEYKIENYIQSKFLITKNLKEGQCFLYNTHNEATVDYLNRHDSLKKYAIGVDQNDFMDGKFILPNSNFEFDMSNSSLRGIHNYFNAYCAALATFKTGLVTEKQIQEALNSFINAPHRLEKVAIYNGIEFVNDSKATNVDSVYYALQSMTKPTILILGGVDKGNDYNEILDFVQSKVKAIVAMGTDNSPILNYFPEKGIHTISTNSLDEAINESIKLAKSGDVVLLSPACASFDLFNNYEDRGDQFRTKILALTKSN